MESEFVALAEAGKEAEWLRDFLLEIPLTLKNINSISILLKWVFWFRSDSSKVVVIPNQYLNV